MSEEQNKAAYQQAKTAEFSLSSSPSMSAAGRASGL